ncbi:alpha-2A adrenergic receptor [Scyliorhinus torazame]|uniref:Alpha-2A adrenergic receptor n=1 Tax=Scyliorhinus torazame TaxID=75743 RepID=A0A401PCS9_SCYTO|nr:hypothetical protein [Scyliorhinus torazame]
MGEDLTGSSYNRSSNSSEPQGYTLQAAIVFTAVVSLIMMVTIFGNVLVMIAVFTSRGLRAPQNLFLVSLAAADILVATLVMPFSLAKELMGYWYFGEVWCEIHLALDVLFCTASIAHLCAISLDRYWSITQAIEYNLKRTPKRIKCIIVTVWVMAAVISFPPLITNGNKQHSEEHPECEINTEVWYIISSCIGSFFAPCIIMILVYVRIYQIAKLRTRHPPGKQRAGEAQQRLNGLRQSPKAMNGEQNGTQAAEANGFDGEDSSSSEHQGAHCKAKRKKAQPPKARGKVQSVRGKVVSSLVRAEDTGTAKGRWKGRQNREKRFTFVLSVVIGVFVVCWFPFFFTYSLTAICPELCPVPPTLFKFFFWFGYCNSSLNPLIYTIFNQDFRKAFKKILCRGNRRQKV